MTDNEYEKLKAFYISVEESLTLQNYRDILELLEIPITKETNKTWYMPSYCHNEVGVKCGLNLRFNTLTRFFTCYSACNCSYNIFNLIVKVYSTRNTPIKPIQALKIVCEYKSIPFNFNTPNSLVECANWKRKDGIIKYSKKEHLKTELKIYDKSILNMFPKIYRQEWLDDNISIETMQKYNIRYYPYKDEVVIPCYNIDGDLIGIRIRRFNQIDLDNGLPKYQPLSLLNGDSYEFATNETLYGLNFNKLQIEKKKMAILVEGEKAVLQADTMLGDKSTVVALYGSVLSKSKLQQLISLGVNRVVIALDSDFKAMYDEQGNKTDEFIKFEERVFKIFDMVKSTMDIVEVVYNNVGLDMYKENCFDKGREVFNKLWKSRERLK